MKEIGEKIREFRNEKGLSIREMSKRLGISHSYLSRMELGEREINSKILADISSLLDVPIEEFYPESHTQKMSINDEKVIVLDKRSLDLENYSEEQIIEWIKLGKEAAKQQEK
ncbi:helix-turn-helix domain-containing protein [Bacillus badius]|uniref:helix-turn-helix domain-containing protein n=1 Tax=Bacillus badius TaxID=1455 RepID=UPI001CBE5089|nr:helix-turn-helix transcriptional regulator [Bacillus badius]UAT29482.1 helix-turn-helix domain-containing protein [Bacillus badius]